MMPGKPFLNHQVAIQAVSLGLASSSTAAQNSLYNHLISSIHGLLYAMQLSSLNNLTIYGPKPSRGRAALCSFNVKGLHATDISTLLDQEGM